MPHYRARLTELLQASADYNVSSRVIGCERRRLLAPSSHQIEALDATLEDGTVLPLVLKHLGSDGMLANARVARPSFLVDTWRESVVYSEVLSGAAGTARCYGVLRVRKDRHALVLERVPGQDLREAGLSDWMAAARWLGDFHASRDTSGMVLSRRLLTHDRRSWRRWMVRAAAHVPDADRDTLKWIEPRHEAAVECLAALPNSTIHGDFNASNVLVVKEDQRLRVCPVDWEFAGVGPGLLDLASLTAGQWTSGERDALVGAYLETSGDLYAKCPDLDRALTASRLQVAVQWLGWARHWRPPPEHRQDWLAAAVRAAKAIAT